MVFAFIVIVYMYVYRYVHVYVMKMYVFEFKNHTNRGAWLILIIFKPHCIMMCLFGKCVKFFMFKLSVYVFWYADKNVKVCVWYSLNKQKTDKSGQNTTKE